MHCLLRTGIAGDFGGRERSTSLFMGLLVSMCSSNTLEIGETLPAFGLMSNAKEEFLNGLKGVLGL